MSALPKDQEQHVGSGVIEHLTETLAISRTMLAALLGVTDRTLHAWRSEFLDKLESNPKSKRLMVFYNVVQKALSSGVKKKQILSLLQEAVDPDDENSPTLLYYIVHEPNNSLIPQVAKIMCERFAK